MKIRSLSLGIRQVLVLMITFMAVPFAALILYTGYQQRERESERLHADFQEYVRLFSAEQRIVVENARHLLRFLSYIPEIRHLEAPACNGILAGIRADHPQYATLVVTNPDGDIVCCAVPLSKAVNVKDRTWFQRVSRTRDFVIDDFLVSRSAGKASLPFAWPILDADGRVVVALGVAFDLEAYHLVFDKISLPPASFLVLTDRSGAVLYRRFDTGGTADAFVAGVTIMTPPDGAEGYFKRTDADGVSRQYWFQKVSEGQGGNDVCLFFAIPGTAITQVANRALMKNLGFLSLLFLLTILLAWRVAGGMLADPVKLLIDGAHHVSDGNLEYRLDLSFSTREFSVLGSAFNLMGARLAQKERQRRAAYEELRESEERLRQIFRSAPIGIGMAVGTVIAEVNEGIRDMLGYVRKELVGRPARMLYWSDEVYREAMGNINRDFAELRMTRTDTVWRRKDGGRVDVLLNVAPPIPGNGRRRELVFAVLDVTEARRDREARELSERRLRETLDTIPLIVLMLDREGRIMFANPFLSALAGWEADELIGRDWFADFISAKEAESIRAIFQRAIVDEEFPLHHENAIQTRSGELRLVKWSNTLLRDTGGGVSGISSFGEDVTDLRRAEENLRHSQRMEAVGTLAGGVAHDFNNILGIIVGNADLARERLPPESPAVRFLDEVGKAALRARDVVAQLLRFSRKAVPERRPTDLAAIIHEACQLLRATIPATVEMRIDIAPGLPPVMADPTGLHQILINLCSNAAQSMEDGGVITILLDREPPSATRFLRLIVADTGKGIPPDVLDRIFDPYFTTKEVGKGTGLGLALVRGIVKEHDGEIRVTSRVGEGTIFDIRLPALEGMAPVLPTLPDGARLPGGTETILCVDDEPAIAEMLQFILESLGYRVMAATDPEQALELFRAAPENVHLLLTDMTMPGLTGERLALEMRATRPNLPVILCTGFNGRIDQDRSRDLGFDLYLEKPVQRRELALAIRQVLDHRRGNRRDI